MFARNRNQAESRKRKAGPVASRRSVSRNSRLATRAPRSRRGVLLLVVLSVLVLFLMVGTAFVIVAKQAEKTAKSLNKGTLTAARATAEGELLDEVILQLVRDTDNYSSALRFHSLLGDMYGNDGMYGMIVASPAPRFAGAPAAPPNNPGPTGGQMLEFVVQGGPMLKDFYNNQATLSPLDNAYNGQIVTFLNGELEGRSTRIVGYTPLPTGPGLPQGGGRFRVMNVELADGQLVTAPSTTIAPQSAFATNPTRILINGRPFNGTGVGYSDGAVSATEKVADVDRPIALMPNAAFAANIAQDWTSPGGADETYDAPDFQNMPLAYLPAADRLGETGLLDAATDPLPNVLSAVDPTNPGSFIAMVMPSFHRPDLLNYWGSHASFVGGTDGLRSSTLATNAAMLRRVLLRPNWLDHPRFTGSNPEYAVAAADGQKLARMVYGPWDVDNDNDGVRDSVWIDFGAPVMAGPNGRLVKPLVALLVVDMDGRLNVNAHGTIDLADLIPDVVTFQRLADGTTEVDDIPRGSGYGPADISLEGALGQTDFQRLFMGDWIGVGTNRRFLPGRYGIDDLSVADPANSAKHPGRMPFDLMSQIGLRGWPQWADTLSYFVSPPDLRARYGVGLDVFGQPIYEAAFLNELTRQTPVTRNLAYNSPYEIDLSTRTSRGEIEATAADTPFSLAELERCLRIYDATAGTLPGRLAILSGIASGSGNGLSDRLRITTDSHDLPVPNIALPHEMQSLIASQNGRLPRSAAELIEMRVRAANDLPKFPLPLSGSVDNLNTPAGKVRWIVKRLLAPELADGLRLNVNRALGNGRDDNNNGVVDEPGETAGGVWTFDRSGATIAAAATPFETAQFPEMASEVVPDTMGNPPDPNGKLTAVDHRQLMARHLYVTALTLTAEAGYGVGPATDDEKALAHRIAQWAVNVVDFRDPDNILTAFEYDVNPFNGWDVDGWIGDASPGPDGIIGNADDTASDNNGPERNFVWGAERPELVMTETLSWHDRRTDDSSQEIPYPPTDKATTTSDSQEPDVDYDQRRRPRGAAFIELYNPWAPNPAVNADTHRTGFRRTGGRTDLGVDLAAVDELTRNSPVWRITVYKRPPTMRTTAVMNWDPDDPNNQPGTTGTRGAKIPAERSVYFVGFDPEHRPGNAAWDLDGTAFFAECDPNNPQQGKNPVPPVRPLRYLVVGSGDDYDNDGIYESEIGDRRNNANPNDPDAAGPKRRIDLATRRANAAAQRHTVRLVDDTDDSVNDTAAGFLVQAPSEDNGVTERLDYDVTSECITDVAIIDQVYDIADGYDDVSPTNATDGQRRRRFTLSEPARGYPTKFRGSWWTERPNREGQYLTQDGQPASIDIPLDGPLGGVDDSIFTRDDPKPGYLNDVDAARANIGPSGTSPDPRVSYAFIYLQRLANPLLPWNPAPGANVVGHDPKRPVNPYITVDSMSANLTVFNGRDTVEIDPTNTDSDGYVRSREARGRFASLQRGHYAKRKGGQDATPALWGWEVPSSDRDQRPNQDQSIISPIRPPVNDYERLATTDSHNFNAVPFSTLGFLNKPFEDANPLNPAANPPGDNEAKKVKPRVPFAWLTWNNRPYASGNELMLVPRSAPSKLTRDFTTAEYAAQGWSPYKPPTPQDPDQPKQDVFQHLLGFFYEEDAGGSMPPPPGQTTDAPLHMYRLLEYVHTPSLYAGTQTWLSPMNTAFGGSLVDGADPRLNRQPPFNSISDYRDPGRVNINTIPGKEVWDGLFHGSAKRQGRDGNDIHVHTGPDDDDMAASRRGYGDQNDDPTMLNKNYPTIFANPFRSPDAGNLVPLITMVQPGVNCTLLRSWDDNGNTVPLFAADTPDAPRSQDAANQNKNEFRDSNRNAFFRYQPMTRVANLVTTRSNVYAVWVTIGFFEVEELRDGDAVSEAIFGQYNTPPTPKGTLAQARTNAMFARVYPEGYMLSREAGSETGDIRRMRGFYIIDRTLPAAYEPGADHNVENVIRLKRRIE